MRAELDKTCLRQLVSACQCPLCFRTVKPPVRMCSGGHFFCQGCTTSHPLLCPLCHCSYVYGNPSAFVQVLGVISRLCRHASNGCTMFLEEAGHADHEQYCEWRPVQCMYDGLCKWKGSVNQLMSHANNSHRGNIKAHTEGSINIPIRRNNIYVFEINKVVFCLFVWHKRHYPLCLCLMCYPLSKKDMKAIFSINIVHRGLHFSQSIHPVSDDVDRNDVFSDPEKCIIVPNYMKEGKTSFAYCITPGSAL